jgi:cell division protein FtsW (lipid II flippase)
MIGKNDIYKIDFLLVAACAGRVSRIITIYSGVDPIEKVNSGLYKKQLVWFISGFILMLVFTFVNYKYLGDYSVYIYLSVLFLLLSQRYLEARYATRAPGSASAFSRYSLRNS